MENISAANYLSPYASALPGAGFKIAIAKSQSKDLLEAINEVTNQCLAQLPAGEVDLAIIFSASAFAVDSLLKNLILSLKIRAPLIGCSGMGVITAEGAQKEGLVLALLSLPQVKVSCGSITLQQNKDAYDAGQELGTYLLSNVKGYRRELCLILSDGLSANAPGAIKGLQNILGRSFPIIGGGASDNLEFKQTAQYYYEQLLNKSIVATIFAGKLTYGLGIRHGWRPLGKIRTITESKANIIQKIDGRKPCRLYEDYFAKSLSELKKELGRINVLYPIGIYLPGENEYLLRNIISLNEDGSITTQGDVPQESSIRLMIGTKESALSAARQAALQVKNAMRQKNIKLALVMSAASRTNILGRDINKEISIIREILGESTPLMGFYSFGEFAPLGGASYYGQTYLHNQTIAILGLGE